MHPVLFEIPTPWGTLPIYSYGVMLGTSMIVAWYLVMALGTKKEEMSREQMGNCFIITALCAIAGSRILYILTNPSEFSMDDPMRWIALREGGLVAYGGFLGGFLGSWIYWRIKRGSLLAWADVAAPTLALGLGFTRIGCYLFGCDFGAPLAADAPSWLRSLGTFPGPGGLHENGSPAFVHHVSEYHLAPTAAASLPVHPTQIYECLAGFALFGLTMLVWSRRRFRGQVFLALTAAYGVWRFFIEYVRDDPERGFYFGFSTSQIISLALVPFAGLVYMVLRGQPSTPPAPASTPTEETPKQGAPKSKRKKRRGA